MILSILSIILNNNNQIQHKLKDKVLQVLHLSKKSMLKNTQM